MKRRFIALILVFVLALCLAACGDSNSPSSKEELVGTWQQIMSDGTETIRLTSDGKYISDIRMHDGLSTHNERTWDYSDGKLTVHYTEMGVDSTYTVVIEDGTMKLDNGDSTITYTRK
ncbi:hypothetical protein SAMN02910456_02382 [Ruminococcaceae bacterium YRB3002]|nr:hypothetical protein SAMN02910456_02382 [Ruminococcaceae bacterium YRB3002]